MPVTVILKAAAALALGYLSGSVNYAILVTRLVLRRDIRELGNKNPGTANVARNVGKGWAAVVFFADLLKGFLPMLLAQRLLFPADSALSTFVTVAAGLAAVTGHCKPVFFGFRGGGGVATAIGVYLYIVPVELFASMLVGFALVMLFVRSTRYRYGRWTPIMFVALTPLATLTLSLWVDIPLIGSVSLGGHSWHVVAAVFAVSIFLILMNLRVLRETLGHTSPA